MKVMKVLKKYFEKNFVTIAIAAIVACYPLNLYFLQVVFIILVYLYIERKNNYIYKIMKVMNKYFESIFLTIAIVAIVASYSLNLYLLWETTKQTSYKKEITRLTEIRNSTVSMALYTVYQDSIDNAVQNWLEDGTSN